MKRLRQFFAGMMFGQSQVRREPARLNQPFQRRLWLTDAARGRGYHDGGDDAASCRLHTTQRRKQSVTIDVGLHPHSSRRYHDRFTDDRFLTDADEDCLT